MAWVNVCPDIPDNWRGGRSDTAKVLGCGLRTLDKYAELGRKFGGIDWKPGKRGRMFNGREIKRFYNAMR